MALVNMAPLTTSISGKTWNIIKLLPMAGKHSVSKRIKNSFMVGYKRALKMRNRIDLKMNNQRVTKSKYNQI